jgi:chitodextrinase
MMKTNLCFFKGIAAFILLSIFLVINIQGQTIVYIDPDYTGGGSDGTSAKPWTSWSQITSYNSSTSYLQKRGTTCTLSTPVKVTNKSFVNFGVYGTGTDYANVVYSSTGTLFTFSSCHHSVIDGFHLSSASMLFVKNDQGGNAGVYFTNSDSVGSPRYNCQINNCLIEKFTWAIRMMKLSNSLWDTIKVNNVTIQNIWEDGMFIQGWNVLRGVDINNCYITKVNAAVEYYENLGQPQNVTEVLCPGDGIQISRLVDGWKIHNTTIDRRGSGLKFCIIHGDESSSQTTGGTVENCTIYAQDKTYGGSVGYFSILDTVNFRNNKIYGSQYAMGIQVRWSTVFNCSYNTFSGFTGTNAGTTAVFNVSSSTPVVSSKLHNNTFYNCTNVYYRIGGSDLMDAKNNIYHSVTTPWVTLLGVTKDYNLYYNSANGGTETHGLSVDPKLVNPASGDFRLQPGSFCLNSGISLGYTKDIVGTPISGLPDLGAYEYIATETVPPTVPKGLTASNVTYTDFTLTWTASTDTSGIKEYNVYKNNVLLTKVTTNTTNVTGLTQGTSYNMTVSAVDNQGNVSAASSVKAVTTLAATDTNAPSVPTNLGTSRIGQLNFMLTWTASTDASSPITYDVYKNGTLVTSVTTNSALVDGLAVSNTYGMTVKARDIYNNTSASCASYNVTTLPACTTPDAWTNSSFSNQTGTFFAELDVTPSGDAIDGIVMLSDGVISAYSSMACGVRFYTNGKVDAYNGSVAGYAAVNSLSYYAGISYHIKFVVNVSAKTYDAYVTPAGGSQVTIASGYTFRAAATQLNNLGEQTNSCHLTLGTLTLNGGSRLGTNLALNKTVLASSVLSSSYAANMAVDGSTGSRWVSAVGNDNWIYVDLGTSTTVNSVVMKWPTTGYYPTSYKIQVSNDAAVWTDAYSLTGGTGGTLQHDFTATSARYVRMSGIQLNNSQGQYNLYEFEIYNTLKSAFALDETSNPDVKSLLIYPNPATDAINIRVAERSSVQIIDLTGKILVSEIIETGNNPMKLSLNPGVYIVKIIGSGLLVKSEKLIVR